jgi:tRNA (guanine-N7-)-methyltransferase
VDPVLPENVELPDWASIFGREGPLDVDIGFGKGEFLLALSERQPHVNYVGIEYSRKRLLKLRDKIIRQDRPNVRLAFGEASSLVGRLFAPGTVRAFTLNFPDPWPKRRHAKRRLVTRAFGEVLNRALAPKGLLTLATDYLPYAEQMREELCLVPGLSPQFGEGGFSSFPPDRVETLYERRFREEGRRNYYLRFERSAQAPPPPHKEP